MRMQSVIQCGPYEKIGPVRLPLETGTCVEEFAAWYFGFPQARYTAWLKGDLVAADRPLVRLHSACIWGNLFRSCYCDCCWQLEAAKERIAREGVGLIIYAFDHHGKGVGLRNHFLVYAEGQRRGLELVVDAYTQLGFREDYRSYDDMVDILRHFGIQRLRLLTNNPRKSEALKRAGIEVERLPIVAPPSPYNREELSTKATKLGHLLNGWQQNGSTL